MPLIKLHLPLSNKIRSDPIKYESDCILLDNARCKLIKGLLAYAMPHTLLYAMPYMYTLQYTANRHIIILYIASCGYACTGVGRV